MKALTRPYTAGVTMAQDQRVGTEGSRPAGQRQPRARGHAQYSPVTAPRRSGPVFVHLYIFKRSWKSGDLCDISKRFVSDNQN